MPRTIKSWKGSPEASSANLHAKLVQIKQAVKGYVQSSLEHLHEWTFSLKNSLKSSFRKAETSNKGLFNQKAL